MSFRLHSFESPLSEDQIRAQIFAWLSIVVFSAFVIPNVCGNVFYVFVAVYVVLFLVSIVLFGIISFKPFHSVMLDSTRMDITGFSCDTCKIPSVEGQKHCNLCKVCVDEFDHHCTFLNICIGKRNYTIFFFFIIFIFLLFGYQLVITIWFLIGINSDSNLICEASAFQYMSVTNYTIFISILSIFVFVSSTALFCLVLFHLFLLFTHQRTYPWIIARRQALAEENRKKDAISNSEKIALSEIKKKAIYEEWKLEQGFNFNPFYFNFAENRKKKALSQNSLTTKPGELEMANINEVEERNFAN